MSTPIDLYLRNRKPTPTQGKFLRDRTPVRVLCGGLGSGKTSTGAEAFLDAVLLNQRCDAMMVAPTFPMFWRFMQPAWEASCPKDLIVEHHQSKKYYRLITGQTIWYGSAEIPGSLDGPNLAAFWGDEVRYWPAMSWQNMVSRLRHKSARLIQAIGTTTPAAGWMDEAFNRTSDPDVKLFRISTRENEKNLVPGYIPRLEKTYTAKLVKALVDGEFNVIEGQVYEAFDLRRHIVEWKLDRELPVLLFWDFGVRKGSVLFAQLTSRDTWTDDRLLPIPAESLVIFDELQVNEASTQRVVPMVQARLAKHGIRHLEHIFCDPAGRARDIASGMPSVHLLENAFGKQNRWGKKLVQYQTSDELRWIPNGVDLVNGMLDPAEGPPALYIARELTERTTRERDSDGTRGIVKTLQGFKYPDGKNQTHPEKDGHLEHCADALRYGVINTLVVTLGRPVQQGQIHIARGYR